MGNSHEEWLNKHQPWEKSFHEKFNFRWDDSIWYKQWDDVFSGFGGLNKNSFNSQNVLLDVGCGSRPALQWFNDDSIKYNLDPLLDEYIKIEQVSKYWKNQKIISESAEIFIEQLKGFCDFVLCWNVLDHCYDPILILHNIYTYMKKDSICIMSFDDTREGRIGHPGLSVDLKIFAFEMKKLFKIKKMKKNFLGREFVFSLKKK